MKSLITLFYLVISINTFAAEIKVPTFMVGVKEDKSALKGSYYVYQADAMLVPKDIVAAKTKNSSIEELVSSLQYAYEKNDRDLFFSLFTPATVTEIKKMPPAAFEQNWKAYAGKKNTKLQFYHSHRNGFLIGLKAPGEKSFNIQYVIKSSGQFFFDRFEVDEKDLRYHNIGMYVTYSPMKIAPASLLQTFKSEDENKMLQVQLTEPYIAVLKKTKDGWNLIGQTKDNDSEFSTWPDLDKATGVIRINVEGIGIDPNNKPEILVLESSFPISGYPLNLAPKGQFTP